MFFGAHQAQDAHPFLLSQRAAGDTVNVQLLGGAQPLEAIEQDELRVSPHACQRVLNAAIGDIGQQARFLSGITNTAAFMAPVDLAAFDG